MVEPITPDEITKKVPDAVIEVFNELIAERWTGSEARLLQDEIVTRLMARMDVERGVVFAKGWLDIEPIFERVGWSVEYDKPGYNESYAASFKFSKKRKRRHGD